MSVKAVEQNKFTILGQKVQDYKQLVKLRLSLTVVFSSIMAYLIAHVGPINWLALLNLAIGGFLVTGAANTLNQVLEKDYDRLMKRTANRPLAAGRMKVSEAVMSAGFMSMIGVVLLALFNPWTAFLGMFSMMAYAFVYTPLKRYSSIAVVVGAIPGALPTLIGCVAAQGEVTTLGLTLFIIQFLWQFPHFWSIGWLGFEDYTKAGYKLVPTINGSIDPTVGKQSAIYAAFLIPAGLLPYGLEVTGIISAVVVVILSLAYAYFGWNLYQNRNRKAALQLMFVSFLYIPLTLVVFFFDKV